MPHLQVCRKRCTTDIKAEHLKCTAPWACREQSVPTPSPEPVAAAAGSLRWRGNDDIMPGWLRQPWRRKALEGPAESGSSGSAAGALRERPGSAPRTPGSRASASLPTMGTYEANCFNSKRIQKLFCSVEIRGRGKKISAQWLFHSNKKGFQEVQSVSKLYPKATKINTDPLHFYQWTLEEAIT